MLHKQFGRYLSNFFILFTVYCNLIFREHEIDFKLSFPIIFCDQLICFIQIKSNYSDLICLLVSI